MKDILNACIEGKTLTEIEAKTVMDDIMAGKATQSQIASFLTVLRFRGETVEEMTGFTRSMRDHVVTIPHTESFVIDTCGTGGDKSSTYNISTASAIALSAFGIKVAKHGNRSVSSKSGSADVMDELGLGVQTDPLEAASALREKNMTFLFAPLYHTAMKHAVSPRKEIGFRTIFNILGPLTNPANAGAQVVGVFDKQYGLKMAQTLQRLGTERALFVTGEDGLDEVTITGRTHITELAGGEIQQYTISPEELGLASAGIQPAQVNNAAESAHLIKNIFQGNTKGAAKDILIMNVAAGLYVANAASSLKEGVHEANAAIENGTILQKLTDLQKEKVEKQHA